MPVLETAGKATLFATAISCITAAVKLIEGNFNVGIVLAVVGIALIVIWAFLIDYQAKREARKTALQLFEKLKKEVAKRE